MLKKDLLLIKRYPNRRLYDTEINEYINIKQFIERIKNGRDVRVRDSKTGHDLTRETLLLALIEEDRKGRILPEWVIFQMIKYRGKVEGNIYVEYLEKMFEIYFQILDATISKGTKSPFDMINAFKKFFNF